MVDMDVNNNSLNPFLRRPIIINETVKINPNPESKKPVVSKNSLSVQKHNKVSLYITSDSQ